MDERGRERQDGRRGRDVFLMVRMMRGRWPRRWKDPKERKLGVRRERRVSNLVRARGREIEVARRDHWLEVENDEEE